MKIWPFDRAAEAHDGLSITSAELRQALEPFEQIRRQVGDRLDIMVEFHSLWALAHGPPFDMYSYRLRASSRRSSEGLAVYA